jgi:hypothetical protein
VARVMRDHLAEASDTPGRRGVDSPGRHQSVRKVRPSEISVFALSGLPRLVVVCSCWSFSARRFFCAGHVDV